MVGFRFGVSKYWESRLCLWAVWLCGGKSVGVAKWARMRDGTPLQPSDERQVPELNLEARETNELVQHLPPDVRGFVQVAYTSPGKLSRVLCLSESAITERKKAAHRMLARLLDQRRSGAQLDPQARRPRARRQRGSHASVAAAD